MQESLRSIPSELVPGRVVLPNGVDELLPALNAISSVDQPEASHRLLGRVDSKFVLPRARLAALLQALAPSHLLLRSAGQPVASYVTIYFDTSERRFLHDHLRGRRPRHKLRIRHYLDRRISVLEVKTRGAGRRTDKQVHPRGYGGNELSLEEQQWAIEHTGQAGPFSASAWSSCQRLTLLASAIPERLTIDLNVCLGSAGGARLLRDTVLIERKRESVQDNSPLPLLLRQSGASPVSLSKYVAAMMTAEGQTPLTRFKAVLGRYALPEHWGECRT